MLSYNGYSRNLTYSFINKEINKKMNPTEKIIYEGPNKFKVYLKLPYIGDVSLKIKNCISKFLPGSIQLIYTDIFSKLGQKFNFKDRQPKHLKRDLVYRIKCSCNKHYYGETCRAIKIRFDEHMLTSGPIMSEIGKHLAENPTCRITFDDCEILTYESRLFKRKIIESLFIQQGDNGNLLNDNLKSVPLFLFNLPTFQEQLKGKIFPSF